MRAPSSKRRGTRAGSIPCAKSSATSSRRSARCPSCERSSETRSSPTGPRRPPRPAPPRTHDKEAVKPPVREADQWKGKLTRSEWEVSQASLERSPLKLRPEEITSILKQRIEQYDVETDLAEVGSVLEVGDG